MCHLVPTWKHAANTVRAQVVYSFLLDGQLFVGRSDNRVTRDQRAMDVDEVCSVIAASAPTTDHRASALTTVLQFTHATRRSDMSRRLSLMGQAGRAAAVANGTDYTLTTEDCQRNRGVRKKRTKKFHTGRAQSGTTRSGGGRYGDCGNVDRGCIRSANGKVEGLCRGPCKDAHGNVLSRVSDVPAIFIAAT
jgi:hypothetical protein